MNSIFGVLLLAVLAIPAITRSCWGFEFPLYPQVRGDYSRHSIPASLRKRWVFESLSGDSWSWDFSENTVGKKATISAQRVGDLPIESEVHFLECTDLEGRNRNILCIDFSKSKSFSSIIGSEQIFYLAEESSDCVILHSIHFSSVAAFELARKNDTTITVLRGRICNVLFFNMSFAEFEYFLSKSYSSVFHDNGSIATRLVLTSSPPDDDPEM